MKVAVLIGTRPDAIKMAPLVLRMQQKESGFEAIVISTGQHRDLLGHGLECFGIAPDVDLAIMRDNDDLHSLTGRMIPAIASALEKERPDIVLVHGDTTTALSAALAAFYVQTPVGHVEAGLTTGNKNTPYPEEVNRRLISRIADIHFAPTFLAKSNLMRSGIEEGRIAVTGNTLIDAVQYIEKTFPGDNGPKQGKMVLVTCHRREKSDSDLLGIYDAMCRIADDQSQPDIVFILHKRKEQRSFFLLRDKTHPRIRMIEPLEYSQFINLLKDADVILTDSGGIQEEASYFSKPLVILRNETERTEILESQLVKVVGYRSTDIVDHTCRFLAEIDIQVSAKISSACIFGDGVACDRIVKALRNWKRGHHLFLSTSEEFHPVSTPV
jgi:UDP-N-acetylglucosamine 2-epimerase (non-hydrolysing)